MAGGRKASLNGACLDTARHRLQMDDGAGVFDAGKEFFKNICGAYFQAGGVDAGVASDKFMVFDDLFINEKPYPVFFIIHKAKDADRTWGNV